MDKKLLRTRADRKVAGVLGGLAKYFGIDPALTRIIFVLILIFTGVMPLAFIYLIAMLVIPYDNEVM